MSFAQVRIVEVNPVSQSVKIKNFGSSVVDISSYWLCSRIRYGQLSAMIDFMQWGASGIGRESVAASKGIWSAGDFIETAQPYVFSGAGSDIGVSFWDSTLRSDEFVGFNFTIYPNPVSDYVKVELSEDALVAEVIIYNALGKVLIHKEISIEDSSIDIQELSVGNYFAKVVINDQVSVRQFIKK